MSSDDLVSVARRLGAETSALAFTAPVAYVYGPLGYAWIPHRLYLERYGRGRPRGILLGMNPGPFGMAQTGVPFGDVTLVRDWLGIEGPVGEPDRMHPKRPVEGFGCRRGEVSGRRFWGWARERFGSPDHFFEWFFVANYCPLLFLDEGGRNLTPDVLPRAQRGPLLEVCDRALRQTVTLLDPAYVIGIGRFAADRASKTLCGTTRTLGRIPHPSPASPAANRGWVEQTEKALQTLGIGLPGHRQGQSDPPPRSNHSSIS